jgi:hypothetical protein
LANGAIGLIFAFFAVVFLKLCDINAHVAGLAVLKVVHAADAAKAAGGAMVWTFFSRHPEVTNGAVVFTKLNSTGRAIVAAMSGGRGK